MKKISWRDMCWRRAPRSVVEYKRRATLRCRAQHQGVSGRGASNGHAHVACAYGRLLIAIAPLHPGRVAARTTTTIVLFTLFTTKISPGNMIQLVSFAAAAVCKPNAHHWTVVFAVAGCLHLMLHVTLPPADAPEMQKSLAASKQPSHAATAAGAGML